MEAAREMGGRGVNIEGRMHGLWDVVGLGRGEWLGG